MSQKVPIGSVRGPKGDRGERGPEGRQGIPGPEGAEGRRGPKGDPGPVGPEGAEGRQGPRGNRGFQGDQGPQGNDGAQGPVGPEGKQGMTGLRGEVGPAGLNWKGDFRDSAIYAKNDAVYYQYASWFAAETPRAGEKPSVSSDNWAPLSLRGIQGERGPQGVEGQVGPQGIDGPEGPRGIQGERGIQGMQGQPGPKGNPGDLSIAVDLGIKSGVVDLSSYSDGGVFLLVANGDITGISLPSELTSHQRVFEIIIRQDATGSRKITWPGTWIASYGLKPQLSTTPNALDRVAIIQSPLSVNEIRLVGKDIK